MILPLLAFLTAPQFTASFTPTTNWHSTPQHASYRYHYHYDQFTTLAAKKRSGAMARRKKQSSGSSSSNGFDQTVEEEPSAASKSDSIYSMPPLYDLAFGYRSYEDEVDFLLNAHDEYAKSSTEEPLRILELAAGPARHSLAALAEHPPSIVDSVVALDRSQDMVDYGLENADYELGAPGGRRDDFQYVNGDMRKLDESTKTTFDAVWLLLGSMQHLLTNDDIIACFSSVNSLLKTGGTVVIELPHPRETFSMGECTRNGWTVPLEDGEEEEYGQLKIVWGEEGDDFDPVGQIRHFTVGMELTVNNVDDIPSDDDSALSPLFAQLSNDGKSEVREVVPMRLFTLQEIDALARCAGFEIVARYGALDEEVSIENEKEAFRMVCVLRKV